MSGTVDFTNSTTVKQDSNELNSSIQEVNDLLKFLEIERNKNNKYNILNEALNDFRKSDKLLEDDLKLRLNNILLSESCSQVLNIEHIDSRLYKLLGISFSNNKEEGLNYIENKQLEEALELFLNKKYFGIAKEFQQMTKTDIQTVLSSNTYEIAENKLRTEDKVVELQQTLRNEQELYTENLLGLQQILEEITNLRLQKLSKTTENKIKEFQVKSTINSLRTQILNQKVRVDIFQETTNSVDAYKELIKDVREQQEECRMQISNLEDLKSRYKLVSSTQFEDIFKSYIQYKSSIEKKKMLYDCFKN